VVSASEVDAGHSIPPIGLGDGAATHGHEEWCVGVIPQKETYFPPTVHRSTQGEVKVGIDSVPRSDVDVHTTQNHCFCSRALQEPGVKEVVL
jgi:hypothetical protein